MSLYPQTIGCSALAAFLLFRTPRFVFDEFVELGCAQRSDIVYRKVAIAQFETLDVALHEVSNDPLSGIRTGSRDQRELPGFLEVISVSIRRV